MSDFVQLTKDEFEGILNRIDTYSIVDLPRSKEWVYDINTDIANVAVRIYSTVDKRTNKTRGVGEDAIRIVHWDNLNNKPVGKSKKILRVEGKTTIADRISARIQTLIDNAADVVIIDWSYVREILIESPSSFADSLLRSLDKYGKLTDKQLAYVLGDRNPKGKPTFEAEYKSIHTQPQPITAPVSPLPRTISDSKFQPVVTEQDTAFPTADYPYYSYPFDTFNPVQTKIIPHISEDTNIVIGANTSAGKTICAELLMDNVLNSDPAEKRNRVIYLSPLKSLTSEKYEDWQVRFSNKVITILTGDYTLNKEMQARLADSDIIVMTSEMADSRTRKMNTEKNYWLKEVGLVVVDEAHILSTDRGHAVESGLMRFTKINPDARVLLLSATMPNCDELAEWLSGLNGKLSKVIFSTWRPVRLEMHYIAHPIIAGRYDRPDYQATQEAKRQLAIDIIMGEHDEAAGKEKEKFLVFCHDKGTGRALVKRLENIGVSCYFHNADLALSDRQNIEGRFADRDNGIRVLVSTSTLAWGRNLPARNVIIVGVHRGIQEVDELDIIQMAGRAGRYGIDDKGTVFLLCPPQTGQAWSRTFNNPRPVRSGFLTKTPGTVSGLALPVIAFHLCAEIENQTINSADDVHRWFSRSLAMHQDNSCLSKVDAEQLLSDLARMEMITYTGDYISPAVTGLGKVSAWLYFSPYDIYHRYINFNRVFEAGTIDDVALCWAMYDVPSNRMGYVPRDLQDVVSNYQFKLKNLGVAATDAVCTAVAAHYCIAGKEATGTLSPMARAVKYDIRRIVQALKLIDTLYAKWDRENLWKSLEPRIMYGIGPEMVELVQVKGIGGVTAKKLFERGIKNLHDLSSEDNFKKLTAIAQPARARQWMKEARALL